MSIRVVHAIVPLYVSVDLESQEIVSAKIDGDDFSFVHPVFVTDTEGGTVPEDELRDAFNIVCDATPGEVFSELEVSVDD